MSAADHLPEAGKMVLVPVEPTPEMLRAGVDDLRLSDSLTSFTRAGDCYAAMLAAAPKPGAGWRPIAEAPDETPVWLASADGYVWIGERAYDGDGWLWGNCYMRVYLNTEGKWQSMDNEVDDDYQPILWMPLPPVPPTPTQEQKA